MIKRRIFISFDHDDTSQVNGFLGLRQIMDSFEYYIHRVIREDYIRPASVTVVLIGIKTAQSKWVQWEVNESISQGKGLLGIKLKGTNGPIPRGIPHNAVGGWSPDRFASWIEWAYQNR